MRQEPVEEVERPWMRPFFVVALGLVFWVVVGMTKELVHREVVGVVPWRVLERQKKRPMYREMSPFFVIPNNS